MVSNETRLYSFYIGFGFHETALFLLSNGQPYLVLVRMETYKQKTIHRPLYTDTFIYSMHTNVCDDTSTYISSVLNEFTCKSRRVTEFKLLCYPRDQSDINLSFWMLHQSRFPQTDDG